MTLNELIYHRKQDIGRKGLRPLQASVVWHEFVSIDRRHVEVIIPTSKKDHVLHVHATCGAYTEQDVKTIESFYTKGVTS